MKNITRRNFLAKASSFGLLASTIQFLPARILGKDGTAPSNLINVGCIGAGGISKGHLGFITSSPRTQLMALCDVRQDFLKSSEKTCNANAQKNTKVPYRAIDTCEDYQEVFDRDDIDAVWICTPDHWHVQMAIAALQKGKAVYVEKPVSLTIEEGRILADYVKKNKGVLQVGSQQRSYADFRKAAELVRNGYIGKIKRIDVSLGVFPEEPKDLKEEPIPSWLNYDKWLGQTPWRPYNALRIKSFWNGGWRCFYEYGSRKEGDWGAHHFDTVQWALDRDNSGPCEFVPEDKANKIARHFKYDTGETVYINDANFSKGKPQSIGFIGEEGDLLVNRNYIKSSKPHLLSQALQSGDTRLQVSNDHRTDFLDAFAYGHKNIAPAETGHRTASLCQLMCIARRTNETIKWDAKTETVTQGSAKVKSMLSRARRAPYFLGA
ncbi:MAG: Gfo/Idh/MocA family oxidoreductase [Opitutales bacterium]